MLIFRLLLGISEAAFAGMPFYLSFFFKREELAFRTGLFISAAPIASSFASSLAWLIVRFGDHLSIQSWRLLFLAEGFPSVLVAVWVWYWIPDSPATARWLGAREKKIATLRLRREANDDAQEKSQHPDIDRRGRLKWDEIKKTLTDSKAYLTAAMFFSCNVAFSSMPVFKPTIVKE